MCREINRCVVSISCNNNNNNNMMMMMMTTELRPTKPSSDDD